MVRRSARARGVGLALALGLAGAGLAACSYERPVLAGDGGVDDLDALDAAEIDGSSIAIDALDAPPIDGRVIDAPPIDARVIDAAPMAIDAANTDLDGDMIPNASDNCPTVANPRQANEDSDAWGDVCDLCPHLSTAGLPSNLDGDDLGDACGDPAADAPHCIAWFDGFNAFVAGRYTSIGNGGWFVLGGVLAQATDNSADAVFKVTGASYRRPKVMTRAFIDDVSNVTSTHTIGVASNLGTSTSAVPDGQLAELSFNDSDDRANVVVTELRGGLARTTSTVHPAGFPTETAIAIVLDPLTTAAAVRASAAIGAQDVTVSQTPGSPALADGGVGVRTRRLAASFQYLMIIEPNATGGACPVRLEL